MKAPYSFLRRKTGPYTRASYYIRFNTIPGSRKTLCKSVRSMIEELDWDINLYSPTQKASARAVADEWMKTCLPVLTNKRKELFNEYLLNFWDWNTSSYIKGKLARKKNSIGKAYVNNNKSWIARYVCPHFEGVYLQEVTADMLEKCMLRLHEGGTLNTRTINHILQAIRVPLSEAVRLGQLKQNPARPVLNFGVEPKEKGILSSDEITRLLSLEWDDIRVKGAFILALTGGLRIGEVIGLKHEDILENSIMVRHSFSKVEGLKGTKTGRSREIPLPDSVIRLLRQLSALNPMGNDWVFWRDSSKELPVWNKALMKGFYEALERIGIPDDPSPTPAKGSRQARGLSFHSLRHGCNAMLRGALPDTKLRMVTGHQSTEMSNHYDHLTEFDRSAIIKAQEERLLSGGWDAKKG